MLTFELDGTLHRALNGPEAAFTEAISLMVPCETQAEIDRIWDRIVETGGTPRMCGWIKDRYGLALAGLSAPDRRMAERRPRRRRTG